MFCWGSTIHGELGLGGIEDENIFIPREVDFLESKDVEEIACGENYTVVVTKNGQMYSCGNNDYGQLGHEMPRKRLQLIPGLDAFVFKTIACGNCHTLAVNEWGQLFSWGCNLNGQLGLDTVISMERVPRMVKALGTNVIVQIACGVEHSIALTNDGDLYAWGSNRDGQLGLGSDACAEIKPKRITSLNAIPIAFVACGGYHTVVISKSGAIFSWGRNTFGQLGLNDRKVRKLPCQLRTLRNAKVCYAACGEEFTVFLTMDGGVFTCGAGMYGQLGHGNNTNEILPRQVMELMGSTVTQISCGKKHTLALVPSRGKIYAWGLGGAGQLGNRVSASATTPQVVLGPWSSPSGSSVILDLHRNSQIDCVVRHIFSGGDHCFATISLKKDNIEPVDLRILGPTSQILTVTEEKLSDCQKILPGSPINHELMTYLETVFKSQACINASFLLSNEAHYGCSSKHHGVDFDYAIKLFGIISELDNNTIQELIFTCVTENLIPSFRDNPPDVESLRVYLTLPLYHRFANLSNYSALQTPFSKAVFNLKPEACRVVGLWWSIAPSYYFERLVRMYKSVVLHFVKQSTADKMVMWTESLEYALRLLTLLYKINVTSSRDIRVPYETFHLPELSEYVEIRRDYLKWLTETDLSYYRKIYFCSYPFLFDAEAKTTLLQTDQSIQMQSAMNEAMSRVVRDLMLGTAFLECNAQTYSQFVHLHVSRTNIVNDTLEQLSMYDSKELKRPLRVKFRDEEAEDVGGVRKEFFMLLFAEILDFKYGMFKEYEETRTIWFNSDSLEDEIMFSLIGILCGLAIYNFVIINLPFPLALYKKLLGESVGLNDIKGMSPTIARSLESILEYNESDFEEVFCLNFGISREVFGEIKNFELIPDGNTVPVTLKNKQQYVDLYVDYILNKSVEMQFKAFYKGFHDVCGGRMLELFHSHELMSLLIGNENYDWEELERNADYKEGYSKNDPTIVLFWQVFHELPLEEKKKFLLFLTGSDRIPIQGMKAIKITIQPMTDERFLPAAHTCFNLLDLPRYQTRERLKYKLLQAIQQNQGFSLV
ncbi:probable E3 ubiquitin-protein ligase HERC4 isoform X2 [Monomorium pharaonis]|nr:probable E3 ubiquitin-protein ligase HERC4 isoform X2 [Monomorium pharaonis]XP_012527822.1 probable E3 ubiquitin-protein ligase HERC4 isoform X2 [Monomorium pharaonis]XP_012527823.1 probable E3 ubiquitin-protein ligase HERC4 isoform X2 [Monomorium pharaonis]XP_012527824.1 probable E3 ubiquitin-protein ligase HERC4 isoform X2 [Monomorium pharaonis]XP_036147563.1 probable E3 ubiquitin-protein ligase HERC4 isoform X2 [Monomorium pharaonis]